MSIQEQTTLLDPSNLGDRSEEVTHIIDQMPTKFGLAVSLTICGLVILLFAFSWFIKYPNVLIGQITVNNRQAPVRLVSNSNGRLQLFIDTGKTVITNEYIAVIKNAAETRDVQILDSLLRNINIHALDYVTHRHLFPENLSVGELNQNYFELLGSLYQYLDYYHEKSFEKQKDILIKQSTSLKNILRILNHNKDAEYQKYIFNTKFYDRDSLLFKEKVISAQEFEKEKINWVSSAQQYESLERDIVNNKYQIQDVSNKLEQLNIQKIDKEHQLEISLYNHYYDLLESIQNWKHKYVFSAPFSGKIAYLNFWKNDDYIEIGKEVFSIIPDEKKIVGQVQLPEQGAGKVKIGQDVIIKLEDYPYAQFGSVRGKVANISSITNQQSTINNQKNNYYLVTIYFPNGLLTNYGTSLELKYEIRGTAEIITDKRRFFERLFDNLKHSMK